MVNKPSPKTGYRRIVAAFAYSMNGLKLAWQSEAAFRQELILYVILLLVLFFLPLSIAFKSILFLASSLVLIVELLNSAIEAVVDMASPHYHLLAQQAKDMASAAVFLTLLATFVLWCIALYSAMQ